MLSQILILSYWEGFVKTDINFYPREREILTLYLHEMVNTSQELCVG